MMIKKVEVTFGGESNGEKNTDFGGILRFKPLFFQSAPTTTTKLTEKPLLVVLNVLKHPSKY